MQSYLQKLYVTNYTSTSIRNLRSNITHLSTSFVVNQICRNTSEMQALSKIYIRSKQVNGNKSTVFWLFLFLAAFHLTCFSTHLSRTTNARKQATASSDTSLSVKVLWFSSIMTSQRQLSFSKPLLLFSIKTLQGPLFWTNLQQRWFYIHRSTSSISKFFAI